ncbi:MAG: hypothetical protein RIR48_3027, partial [Bacteroidota bacterium]
MTEPIIKSEPEETIFEDGFIDIIGAGEN